MADFPTSLPNLSGTDYANNTPLANTHPDLHDSVNEELDAVITKVGIDSSADTNSLDYKLKSTSSSNPGHKHTLANGATDVTASVAEVNTLDGITATVGELNLTDGLGDAWTSFTPSWTNITVGSGTSVGFYKQIGKTVIGYVQFTYGSGSSVGAVSLTPPVTPKTGVAGSSVNLGQVIIEDSGSNYFFGSWIAAGPIYVGNSSSTYVSSTALSSSIPMTWTTNDRLQINFCYEAA